MGESLMEQCCVEVEGLLVMNFFPQRRSNDGVLGFNKFEKRTGLILISWIPSWDCFWVQLVIAVRFTCNRYDEDVCAHPHNRYEALERSRHGGQPRQCLAVISVLCFWAHQLFWGVAFAIGAVLVCAEVLRVAYAFMVLVLLWMTLCHLEQLVLWLKAPVMVDAVSIHGDRYAASIPANSSLKTLQYALTTSFGSIRYGSLFEAAIRTLW
ncbi:hypothetical protein Lal_00048084 [Lupinus albus]|nr:hypothetical protein Lal_00048084 [Lupinus albus]